MPIVPMRPLLEAARQWGYAYGAFNVNAVCQAEAVVEMHSMLRSAAIIQGADLANAFMGGRADFKNGTMDDKRIGAKRIADAVKSISGQTDVPVVLHLDHGKDFDVIKSAIEAGYTSVMVDGSHLPYDQNVELTREVVRYAHERGVTVEGELGVLAGMEDNVFSERSTYTNPMQVCDFFRKTEVDCLAISYGTKHGPAKGKNIKLRHEIVIASMENLRYEGIPGILVSHGSSIVPAGIVEEINSLGGNVHGTGGVPLEQLVSVIPNGVAKINIDTDVRLAVTRNIREMFAKRPALKKDPSVMGIWKLLEQNPAEVDPRAYITPIMEILISGDSTEEPSINELIGCLKHGVYEIVGAMAVSFGSAGKLATVKPKTLDEMAEFYRNRGRN